MSTENTQVALEAIDFQGDKLFKKLVKVLGTLPESERKLAKRAQWEKLEKGIEKVIKDELNLQIVASINNYPNFIVQSVLFDLLNILNITQGETHTNPDKLVKYLTDTGKKIHNSVDLKRSKFSGLVSEMKFPLAMAIAAFVGDAKKDIKFTDGEIAAIILHEIGHIGTAVEMLDRTVATNQVMAEMQRNLYGGDVDKRETYIKGAINDLSLDRNLLSQVEGKDNEVVTTIIVSNAIKNIRSQSGHSFYDMNTWEMLSDQFAVRHGAGAVLGSATRKVSLAAGEDLTEMSSAQVFCRQIVGVGGSLTLGILGVFGIAAGSAIFGALGLLFGVLMVFSDHAIGYEPTYDNTYSRYRRIRLQIMQQVKMVATGQQTNFTEEYKASLLTQVQQMDDLMRGMEDRKSLVQRIQMFFSSNQANRHANIQFQKELEGLANNDLYAKAVALKTL